MTVPHPFRRTAAVLAACALLAVGLVTLAMSQSQPARAASVGEFTMTPGSGRLTDPQPLAGSLAIPGMCPDVTLEELNWNSVLNLYVVKADGTEVTALSGITSKGPYTAATSAISLAAADNSGLFVGSLSNVITGDGTYELRVRCVDNFDWAVAPDSIVPGDPYWSQKITVTGDTWVVGEGATATGLGLAAVPGDVEPGAQVKLTATVSPAEATGTVTFLDGTTTLGEAAVTGGRAEFTTTTLTQGRHDVTARFTPADPGDWGASEAPAATVLVYPADYEIRDDSDTRLAVEPELRRGQKVKLVARGCAAGTPYTMTMSGNDTAFPAATADASGVVTWPSLTVPDNAVAGRAFWTFTAAGKNCKVNAGTGAEFSTASFTVPEPSTGSASPTGDPSDDPTGDPTDDPTGEPTDGATDGTSGGTSGGSSGTTSGTTSGSTGGDSGTGGTSTTGGGLASTGSEIALFSGIGAVVLFTAGLLVVRFGRRSGLLTFGDPRA
ncbi:Ig-like domain-containing protein [Streptomyces sp. NPDC002740]